MSRQLVIMGSGETTPGMLGLHRQVFAGLDAKAPRLLLDSPFAFQMNSDELVDKISRYFADSVGVQIEHVTLPADADELTVARAVTRIGSAGWVFAGPGSPSYARRAWVGTGVPEALAEVVAPGRDGVLLFASAAAVTLGDWSLPVYEIYKVGQDPYWEPGLGLMSSVVGLPCAVVPHYDNQEGGTHDTRFCWIGQQRLTQIEPQLEGGFILGVDEHTALVIDLDEQSCAVHGRGGVTVRVAGQETIFAAGQRFPVARIREIAASVLSAGAPAGSAPGATAPGAATPGATAVPGAPLPAADPAPDLERIDPATPADVSELAGVVLAALPADAAPARAALVALADLAATTQRLGAHDHAAPFVDALVHERQSVRAAKDWAGSDRIRDLLVGLGVEVRDTKEGSEWLWLT